MNGTTLLKEPLACTAEERQEFARLVRRGFEPEAEILDGRIRDANCLAFFFAAGETLAAIAALKAPNERYRVDVFKQAYAPVSAADYELELGWVFVVPAYRRKGIAASLCKQLIARVPESGVFATTRTDNFIMMKILSVLGFARVGKPYPRRDEELVLYVVGHLTPAAERAVRS